MAAFLQSQRASLAAADPLVVVGNSSADLDSVVSAVVWAAYADEQAAVAVVACRRSEFRLRSDSLLVLPTVLGVAREALEALLVFEDDVAELLARRRLRGVLVDHHVTHWPLDVVAIVDHHERAASAVVPPSCALSYVAPVGSCCTLVGALLAHRLAADAAALLLWTIAADTLNFDAALRRATPLDVSVARFLHAVAAPPTPLDAYCAAAHDAVARAKADVAALTPAELLRRDYKSLLPAHSVGLASVPVPVAAIAEADLAACCAEHGVASLVVFAALAPPPAFVRQLAVYSRDAALHRFFAGETLIDAPSPLLRRYVQRDVTASRKVIVPRLLEALTQ